MEKIEIFVACHKLSEIPDNELFKPIHVGAKVSKIKMPGLLRDDIGDNISEKNPNYCEMTAQYWAWKHSDADYIGLCHYRRYLCLSDQTFTNYTSDFRKQLYASSLTMESERKYGLLDVEQMKKVIEDNDIIVCTAQDLSKVNTPLGPQKTTLQHWIAHDMALINVNDLKKLFQIVRCDYPQIYVSLNEYMHGKYFYGFNTFIMRKDLFHEMCEFEFDVLEKLEKQVDISQYNQQLSRIYGFMGEILFSSFIYHIQKNRRDIRIKECPIIYFEETDPVQTLIPELNIKETIVFDLEEQPAFLLYPLLYTFLQKNTQHKKYEVIVLSERIEGFYKKYYATMVSEFPEITLKFQETHGYKAYIKEVYGELPVFHAAFLPWILQRYDKVVYIKWNTLVQQDISQLIEMTPNEYVKAVKDIYYQGKLNSFYKEYKKFAQSVLGISNIFDCINTSVLVMNLQNMRLQTEKAVTQNIKKYYLKKHEINDVEVCNALWLGNIEFMSQKYNWLINSNEDIKFYINEAPLNLVHLHNECKNRVSLLSYQPDFPWHVGNDNDIEKYIYYWEIIKKGKLIELFYQYRNDYSMENFSVKPYMWKIINVMLPKNTKRRTIIKKMFPKTGFVRTSLKNILDK